MHVLFLKEGVDQLADAVKVTLDQKVVMWVLEKKYGSSPDHKGWSNRCKDIELSDPYKNMGAQMVKEVASKQAKIAGTVLLQLTVLHNLIINVGLKNITAVQTQWI